MIHGPIIPTPRGRPPLNDRESFAIQDCHWPICGLLLVAFAILAFVACTGQDGTETTTTPVPGTPAPQTPRTIATPAPTPTGTQASPPDPSHTPSLSPTPHNLTSSPSLSESELYRRIAPSVALIETPIVDGGVHRTYHDGKVVETDLDPDYTMTGSGVLVAGGYIITGYGLVWPYQTVRVVFPDGSEFEEVPVANFDPLSGVAVLGPVDAPAPPLTLEDGEGAAMGADLFLMVYAAANDEFPQPVMGRGSLQALWEAKRAGVTFFETDVALAEGYIPDGRVINGDPANAHTVSGGALVNQQGELIGVSVPIPHRERLSLAASAADLAPIVKRLISGEVRPELGDRRLPLSGERFEFDFETRDDWHRHWRGDTGYYRRFLVQEPVGALVKIEFTGHGHRRAATLHDAQGRPVLDQQMIMGVGEDSGSVMLRSAGAHFLTVRYTPEYHSGQEQFGRARLRSNVRLTPLHDPDDGKEIAVGETIAGNQDAPYDRDWFRVSLEEGETVVISGESLTSSVSFARMTIDMDFPRARENQKVHFEVNTDAGGVRGADESSSVVYRAPHGGEFFLDVAARGGYYLSVEEATATGAEPVFIPPSPRVEGEVEGPFGPMTVYQSQLGNFSIQVPAGWEFGLDERHQPFAEYYGAYGPDHEQLRIGYDNETIAEFTPTLEPLEVAAFFFLTWAAPNLNDDELVSREVVETAQGIPSERFVLAYSDRMIALATYYLPQDDAAVCVVYYFPAEDFDKFKGLADYSFSTFRVD